MPCLKAPAVALPDFGALSASPPRIPIPPLNADLCCKIVAFSHAPVAIPLPPLILNGGFVKSLRTFGKVIQDGLDTLQVKCPRESPSSQTVGS